MSSITRADIERLAGLAAGADAPSLPLIRAAADRAVNLAIFADHTTPWEPRIDAFKKPTIVCISADPGWGLNGGGPADWVCTAALKRWARAVIIHAAAGEPEHYRAAGAPAAMHHRVALVETSTAHAAAWGAALRCTNSLLIWPRGGVHPVAPAKAAVQ